MRNSVRNGALTALVAALVTITTMLLLLPFAGNTAQNNLYLPTTGTYSGLTAANTINSALNSLLTCNSGNTAPTNALGGSPLEGQCWLDTTSSTLKIKKIYSGSGWVVDSVIDVSNGIAVLPVGGGTGTVTAASTTNLCTSPQAVQTVSGSTTITSFGSSCVTGVRKTLIFSGAPSITYNATSMILPASVDYAVTAGDVVEAVALGSGNWRVVGIMRANGQSVVNPAVEISSVQMFFGAAAPAKYVFGFGQAISRASFPDYVTATTKAQNATRSSGSNVLTSVADTSGLGAGMPIEGTGIPAGATIASVTSNSITMAATCSGACNASSSGTSTATVFLTGYGQGGTTSTIGVPDCRGRVIAGRDDMGGTAASRLTATYFGAVSGKTGTALNADGGTESHTLTVAQMPSHNHGGSTGAADRSLDHGHSASVSGGTIGGTTNGQLAGGTFDPGIVRGATGITVTVGGITSAIDHLHGITAQGGGGAHPNAQPTLIANCIIRVLAMAPLPANDNLAQRGRPMPVAYDRRLA